MKGPGALERWIIISLCVTLALLPFESLLFATSIGGVAITELEIATDVTLLLWAGLLWRERRLPSIPKPVLLLVAALIVVSIASASLAGPLAAPALRFVARSITFWCLFLVMADLVRTPRTAGRLIACALTGAGISAAVGWLAILRGTSEGLLGFGRDFTVAGTLRVAGTFDYPNTAAMAWEALLLVGLPLVILPLRASTRAALVAVLLVIASAMLLTFSRGAVLGAVSGLAVISVLAVRSRLRWPAFLAAGSAAVLVIATIGLQLAVALPVARLTADGENGFYGATYQVPAEISLPARTATEVPVTLTNTGTATWSTETGTPFALGYHWLDVETGAVTVLDGVRTHLPAAVRPGETRSLDARVEAPRSPGRYQLAWDVVREGVTWFSEKGVPGGASTVVVGAAGTPGQASAGSAGQGTGTPAGGSVVIWPDLLPVPQRTELWSAALSMVAQQPLLGIGPGTYRLAYGQYLGWERWDERIHSNQLYLELAATTGIVGLAVFLALAGVSMRPAARSLLARWGGPTGTLQTGKLQIWALQAGLIGAMVAFMVHGIVDYFLGFGPTGLLFWALLGMTLGLGLGSATRPAGTAA